MTNILFGNSQIILLRSRRKKSCSIVTISLSIIPSNKKTNKQILKSLLNKIKHDEVV